MHRLRSVASTLFDFDIEALDLLVKGGEGDAEVFRGFRLIPVATL